MPCQEIFALSDPIVLHDLPVTRIAEILVLATGFDYFRSSILGPNLDIPLDLGPFSVQKDFQWTAVADRSATAMFLADPNQERMVLIIQIGPRRQAVHEKALKVAIGRLT